MNLSEKGLLPCPFCGNADKPSVFRFEGEPYVPGFEVRCDASGWDGQDGKGCGSASGWSETTAEAIAAWNRRAYLQAAGSAEWQPIETAPKDGTRVILLLSTGAGDMVHVGRKDQRPNSGWEIEPNGYWSSVVGWIPLPATGAAP